MSNFLASRSALIEGFNGRPALLAPLETEKVASLLMGMMSRTSEPTADEIARAQEAGVSCMEQAYNESFARGPERKQFLFSNGLAFIPMRGVLVHRNGDPWAGTRGYDDIRKEFDAAMADPDVAGIVFDAHSGGGMVYGNFELCDHIRGSRAAKPSMTVVNAGAMSGAYSLASATGRVVTTPSGDTGSIGVLTMHADVSKALEKFGVQISLVHAGAHKVDGNPFTPLSDSVRADMQSRINIMYNKFVSTVAANRGMSEQAVRDTEARVYQADEAVKIGLVDAIMSPSDAVAAFRAEIFGSSTTERSTTMSGTTDTTTTAAAPAAPAATAAAPAAPAATAAAPAAAAAPSAADAVIADRQRSQAIINSDEAKGREKLATHLALNTSMSVDDAKATLAAAPAASAAAPAAATKSPLDEAIRATGGGANVANNGGGGGDEEEGASAHGSLLDAHANATGNKSHLRVVQK